MKHLCIKHSNSLITSMPAATMAPILGSQCGFLQYLTMSIDCLGLHGPAIVALAALTRLECLEVCSNQGLPNGLDPRCPVVSLHAVAGRGDKYSFASLSCPHRSTKYCFRFLQVTLKNALFEDRGLTLLWTVEKLPDLTDLRIMHKGRASDLAAPISGSHGLPECKELAELHSRSLTQLFVSMLGGPPENNTLLLSGLPELRSCTICGSEPATPLNMRIDGASFSGAPQLQELHIENDQGLQLQHDSFQQLSALTWLGLKRCGLSSVPANMSAIGATLCALDLSHNRIELDGAAVADILQCSSLRAIDLYRQDISTWQSMLGPEWDSVDQQIAWEQVLPTKFCVNSLTHLLHLTFAFGMQHGRELHVKLDSTGIVGT